MKSWLTYNKKHDAEIVSEYVNKSFTMFSHYPTKIREETLEKRSSPQWIIEIDDYCSQYTTTLTQASCAAQDFLAGYDYALREPAPQWRKKKKGEKI